MLVVISITCAIASARRLPIPLATGNLTRCRCSRLRPLLFFVMDPLGNVPLFLTALERLMGMLLVIVAVQMPMRRVAEFLRSGGTLGRERRGGLSGNR